MEGNLSQGGMIPGGDSFRGLDLQGSMKVHHQTQQHPHILHQHHHPIPHQGSLVCPSIHEGFPLTIGTMQSCEQTMSMADYSKGERGKNLVSDDEDPSFTEDGGEGHNDASKWMKGSPWHRVKWTDKMVKLLITAVSYIGEDAGLDCGGGARRRFAFLQKKGKWKSVSKVMAERGFSVSPQQCEDKFNDLNKRYKKLNDILGRGTSCQVVENPRLLDAINFLTEKKKDDVRKILSSKQLFYEEMCSYHNGNRLFLPHDPALQHSLQLALRSRDDHDNDDVGRHRHDPDEDDENMETDDHDEFEEKHASHGDSTVTYGVPGSSSKRLKQGPGHEDTCLGNSMNLHDFNKNSFTHPQVAEADMNQVLPENMRAAWLQKQWIESRSLQLEEQKLQIQVEKLELDRQQFKWQRFSKKQDHELEKLRMENERMRMENEGMKLENQRVALDLKQKEMRTDFN